MRNEDSAVSTGFAIKVWEVRKLTRRVFSTSSSSFSPKNSPSLSTFQSIVTCRPARNSSVAVRVEKDGVKRTKPCLTSNSSEDIEGEEGE